MAVREIQNSTLRNNLTGYFWYTKSHESPDFSAKSGGHSVIYVAVWISGLKFGIWRLVSTTDQFVMKDKTDLSWEKNPEQL